MSNRFEDAFLVVVGHEGGLSLDRNDRGNWTSGVIGKGQLRGTKFGVSAMSYPTLDIPNLTLDDARRIYRANYWNAAGCPDLPDPLALVVFDTAVNSGVGRARQFLAQTRDWQEYLNVRLRFMQGIATWSRYGRGWTKRVNTLRQQAAAWEEEARVQASIPALPPRAEGEGVFPLEGCPGFSRVRVMKRTDGSGLKFYAVPDGKEVVQ